MLFDRLASDAVLDAAYTWMWLRRRDYPDKTFIGRIERGFDFLGYRFSRDGLTVAHATVERFLERLSRLYERGRERPDGLSVLGAYVRRWYGWVKAGLGELGSVEVVFCPAASQRDQSKPHQARSKQKK